HSSLRELKCSWVSLLGILIEQWSARIWKSHDLSSLVKCLPHSTVLGLPNHLHLKIVGYKDELRMASAYSEAKEGEGRLGIVDEVCKHVCLHMVHFNQRNIQSHRQPFGKRRSYQQSAHKS